ncbi:MAG: ABC transporter substrate-binding protein [Pseudomonadota bacterium]|nr:ABC transporter substrate-binding protein [Pseudomonadota bacterium]
MIETMGRRLILSLPVALLAQGAYAQQKDPFRFGALMPTTGPEAGYGLDFVKTYEMAVKDINDKGGVNGRPLEMLVLDTQAKPELAINAANKLIDVDRIPLIITAWSSVVKAVAPIANRTSTLELNMGANSPDIAHLGEYVYTVFPLAEVDVTALAKYTRVNLRKSRAAVLYVNNDTGIGGAKIYRDVFTAAGGQVVAFEAYDPKATDFTGVLLKARVGNPDVVHIQGLSELPQVIAQLRQLGMTQQVTSYSSGYNPKLLSQLGSAAEGLIVTSLAPTADSNPNVAKLLELWKQVGRAPNGLPYLQYAWDSTVVVAKLYGWLDQNKLPITGENCRKALLAIRTFDLPMTGKLVVTDDHRVDKPVYLYVVKNGRFALLDTIA